MPLASFYFQDEDIEATWGRCSLEPMTILGGRCPLPVASPYPPSKAEVIRDVQEPDRTGTDFIHDWTGTNFSTFPTF